MNTSDPSAARIIEKRAPILHDWLETIHRQGARGLADGEAPTPHHGTEPACDERASRLYGAPHCRRPRSELWIFLLSCTSRPDDCRR